MLKEQKLTPRDFVISQTDLKGRIIYANPIFYRFAGYENGMLIGKTHATIQHHSMPNAIFKLLWEKLNAKEDIYCFIKNSSKERDYYWWIFAHIYPSFNPDGSVRNYISTSRAVSEKAKGIMESIYKELLRVEIRSGVEVSTDIFRTFIDINRYGSQSDNEVICNIQY
jgi:PAS domain S-box-containing protein